MGEEIEQRRVENGYMHREFGIVIQSLLRNYLPPANLESTNSLKLATIFKHPYQYKFQVGSRERDSPGSPS